MARVTILRARFSPSDLASCSISRDDQGRFPLGLVLDRGHELGPGRLRGEPGDALELLAALGVLPVQFGGTAVEVVPALVEGLGAVFDALELLVEPLLAIGETGFTTFEVAA